MQKKITTFRLRRETKSYYGVMDCVVRMIGSSRGHSKRLGPFQYGLPLLTGQIVGAYETGKITLHSDTTISRNITDERHQPWSVTRPFDTVAPNHASRQS